MKFVKQKVELLKQGNTLPDMYKHIEKCGRLCYKSEDKITNDSYIAFIERLIKMKHYSVLEHGTVYLAVPIDNKYCDILSTNKYSKCAATPNLLYVSTNYRVIVENELQSLMRYWTEFNPKFHYTRSCFKILTNIGTIREINRHRVHSISEESTRYCNYNKNKFGGELTFLYPLYYDNLSWYTKFIYTSIFKILEKSYKYFITKGLQPQEVRDILPLNTKTESIHTAFNDDWKDFIAKRNISAAHPLAQLIAQEIEHYI